MALLSVWALMWGYSFVAAFAEPPSDDGIVRDTNRATLFIGWQLAASLPAFAAWALGRDWPPESGVRRVSRVPLQLASAVGAVLLGLVAWALAAG